MKIGVLTLPLHNNFGGILQAYALQQVLNSLGHNAVLIDKSKYVSLGPWYKKFPIYFKRAIRKYLGGERLVVRADVAINNTLFIFLSFKSFIILPQKVTALHPHPLPPACASCDASNISAPQSICLFSISSPSFFKSTKEKRREISAFFNHCEEETSSFSSFFAFRPTT